jgi:hypothetical protein
MRALTRWMAKRQLDAESAEWDTDALFVSAIGEPLAARRVEEIFKPGGVQRQSFYPQLGLHGFAEQVTGGIAEGGETGDIRQIRLPTSVEELWPGVECVELPAVDPVDCRCVANLHKRAFCQVLLPASVHVYGDALVGWRWSRQCWRWEVLLGRPIHGLGEVGWHITLWPDHSKEEWGPRPPAGVVPDRLDLERLPGVERDEPSTGGGVAIEVGQECAAGAKPLAV